MLLDEVYGFNVGSLMVNPGIDSNTFFENWRHWRINEFQPEKVVESSGMTTDQTKEL